MYRCLLSPIQRERGSLQSTHENLSLRDPHGGISKEEVVRGHMHILFRFKGAKFLMVARNYFFNSDVIKRQFVVTWAQVLFGLLVVWFKWLLKRQHRHCTTWYMCGKSGSPLTPAPPPGGNLNFLYVHHPKVGLCIYKHMQHIHMYMHSFFSLAHLETLYIWFCNFLFFLFA